MDVIGGTSDRNVMIAVGGETGGTAFKTEVKRVIELNPERVGKKDVKRALITRVAVLSAAAVAFIAGGAVLWNNLHDNVVVSQPAESTTSSAITINTPVEAADPLSIITDKNMPEPFEPEDPDRPLTYSDADLHDDFTGLWQLKFRTLENIVPYLENAEKVDELYETYRAEQQYDRQAGNVTRYRIDDTINLYRFMKDLGMSGEEMEAAVTKMDEENRPLVDEGNLSYDVLFDLYEGIFGRENKEDMALTFKSDYAIAVGEYVFSPRWMYYHTVEDYRKAGITATQVELMLRRYRELGLTNEAWEAFFKKLNAYITYYKKTSETRIYPVSDEDCYGMTFSEALDILEQHFYGSWKRKPASDGEYGTVTFTYSQDIFDHSGFHRPICMGETDDIWYMECMSSGESEVWVIEKSDPTVMYCTGLVFYNGYDGQPALNLDAEWVAKYEYEQTLVENQLRPGKISVLGMDKLFSIYGDDFMSFYYEVIEGGYMDDHGTYYTVGYDMMTAAPDMYLVGRSDNSVTLGIRYFKADEYQDYLNDMGEAPTEYYFAVTFTLRENAGWGFSYENLRDVYADLSVMTFHSSQMERFISEFELKDVELRGSYITFQSAMLRVTDTMDEAREPVETHVGNPYLAALNGHVCGKDIQLRNLSLSNGNVVVVILFPNVKSGEYIVQMFFYDGKKLDEMSYITEREGKVPAIKDINDITVKGNSITVYWADGGTSGGVFGNDTQPFDYVSGM